MQLKLAKRTQVVAHDVRYLSNMSYTPRRQKDAF